MAQAPFSLFDQTQPGPLPPPYSGSNNQSKAPSLNDLLRRENVSSQCSDAFSLFGGEEDDTLFCPASQPAPLESTLSALFEEDSPPYLESPFSDCVSIDDYDGRPLPRPGESPSFTTPKA